MYIDCGSKRHALVVDAGSYTDENYAMQLNALSWDGSRFADTKKPQKGAKGKGKKGDRSRSWSRDSRGTGRTASPAGRVKRPDRLCNDIRDGKPCSRGRDCPYSNDKTAFDENGKFKGKKPKPKAILSASEIALFRLNPQAGVLERYEVFRDGRYAVHARACTLY